MSKAWGGRHYNSILNTLPLLLSLSSIEKLSSRANDKETAKEDEGNSKRQSERLDYLVVKKPIKKSVFYQHSRQGMKYWYEEQKPVSCEYRAILRNFFEKSLRNPNRFSNQQFVRRQQQNILQKDLQ